MNKNQLLETVPINILLYQAICTRSRQEKIANEGDILAANSRRSKKSSEARNIPGKRLFFTIKGYLPQA
jgi:hypothetical protein